MNPYQILNLLLIDENILMEDKEEERREGREGGVTKLVVGQGPS